MSSFENFVQCRIVTPFTAAATEIGLFAADTPHRLPAEGGGVLVLTDSPYRPSVLEVIRYGRRSGLALYDVSRAQEGTTARDWTGVAFCYQALTAGELALLLAEKADVSALNGLRQEAQTALDSKVDKIAGKGLSTNDYTTAEKNKLANANLTALVGLTGAADHLPYFTGAGALSLATITAAARTLLAATNVAGQQSALGLFADASGVMTNASGALTNWVSQLLRSADAAAGRSALGLGTVATRDVQTSAWDAIAGRLMAVGAFGLGATSSGRSGDLNQLVASGFYPQVVDTVNGPDTHGSTINLIVIGNSAASGRTTQLCQRVGDGKLFHRSQLLGVWGGWVEIHTSGNQLSLGSTLASAKAALDISGWGGVGPQLQLTSEQAVDAISGNGSGITRPVEHGLANALPYAPMLTICSADTYWQLTASHLVANIRVNAGLRSSGRNYTVDLLHTGNAHNLPSIASLSPATDNGPSLGAASRRWASTYLGTAPIVTSDRDAKQDILPIDDAVLDAWATLDYMQYRLKDAVALKGGAARIHAGLIAQDIREAFQAAGLDPFKYGVLCYDEWGQELLDHPAEYEWITVPAVLDNDGNELEPERRKQGALIREPWTEVVREAGHRYSVRYEEAFALECALQRRTTQRLEQRLAALESAA